MRLTRVYLILVLAAASSIVTARGDGKPIVVKTTPMSNPKALASDCVRYLRNAFQYSFHPFSGGLPRNFDWLVTRSPVRVISETADEAVRRVITGSFPDEAASQMLYISSRWPVSPSVQNEVKNYARERIALLESRMKNSNLSAIEVERAQDRIDSWQMFAKDDFKWGQVDAPEVPTPNGSKFVVGRGKKNPETLTGKSDKAAISRDKIIEVVTTAVNKAFPLNSAPAKLVDDIFDIVINASGNNAHTFLASNNEGVISYIAKSISNDPVWMTDALDFYSRLYKMDHLADQWAITSRVGEVHVESIFDSKSSVDIWSMALETTGGDPVRALRVLSTFGHDDLAHSLRSSASNHPEWLNLLNSVGPDQNSLLYANGAFGGLDIPAKMKADFAEMREEGRRLQKKYPDANDLNVEDATFRSANYHFIGGSFVASELIYRGHDRILGTRTPVFVSELLGEIYKRLTMEADYLSGPAKELYEAGYPKKAITRPATMDEKTFEISKYQVRMNLLFLEQTKEQHRLGAERAYEILRSWSKSEVKTRY
jgi:hypothetical protein